jgi:molybdopterin converting factor subunit 1
MRITVKLFAILRDRAGVPELTLDLPRGSATSVALELVATTLPSIRELLPRAALAINREYVPRDATLNDGDELALIPPVSGG